MLTACTSLTFSWILYQFLLNKSSHRDQDEMRHLTRHRVIFSIAHTKTFFPGFHVKHENKTDNPQIYVFSDPYTTV